jgi:hypothetical protein
MAISKIVVSCNAGYGPLSVLYDHEQRALFFADLRYMMFYHALDLAPIMRPS